MVVSEVLDVITICQAIYDRKGTVDDNNEDLNDLFARMKTLLNDFEHKEIPKRALQNDAINRYMKVLNDMDIFIRKQNKNFIMRLFFAYGTKEKIDRYNQRLNNLDNDFGPRSSWKERDGSYIPVPQTTTAIPIEVPKPSVEKSSKWSLFGRKKTENVSTPPKITQSQVEPPKITQSQVEPVKITHSQTEPPKSASSSLDGPLVLSEQEKKAEELALINDEDEDATCLEPAEKCVEITEGVGMFCLVLAQITMACSAVC